jgi:hypothetical protein
MHRIVDRDAGGDSIRNRCGLISRPMNQVGSKSQEGIGQLPEALRQSDLPSYPDRGATGQENSHDRQSAAVHVEVPGNPVQ